MLNNNWCFDYYKEGTQELMYNIMDYIVCVSGYCAQQFHVAFPNIKQSKILICNNVLDFHELDKIKKHEPNQLDLENGTIRICFVGRLTQEKHPDIAIAAINYLINHGFNAKLDILGEGYMYGELNRLIQCHNLTSHVQLLGYHPKPYQIIADHDILISISDIEGAPLNIAEAYYLGIPILSSHSGGSDDFASRFGGLTYTDISYLELAKNIKNLFANHGRQYYMLKSQINYENLRAQFGTDALLTLFDGWLTKIQSDQID
ncbi:MAG: glycosyltransferase [Muribaculaceae bacterium]|nr:glycosyltransferase [Muribaculaceae bacterium]